jgi:hypothetical protein
MARPAVAAVDAVPLLKPARHAGGGAIQLVADRGALVADSLGEDRAGQGGEPLPVVGPQAATRRPRIETGAVEDLGGVDVADAGHGPLVEQRHLHGPPRPAQPFGQFVGRHPEPVGTELGAAAGPLQAAGIEQPDRAQAALVPEQEPPGGRAAARQRELEPHVLRRRRIGDEHQPRHPRLDDEPPGRIAGRGDLQHDPLAAPPDAHDRAAGEPSGERGGRGRGADRPHAAARKRGRHDPAADAAGDPAAHRLDLGQFGHGMRPRASGGKPSHRWPDGSSPAAGYNRRVARALAPCPPP